MFKSLGDDGQYRSIERSLSFAHLRSTDLEPFLKRRGVVGENALEQEFRQWLRESLGKAEG